MKANDRNTFFGMVPDVDHAAAEKCGCGIFAAKRGAFRLRIVGIVYCVIMVFTCLATACQPTPETPPVIRRIEDVPKEAIIEPAGASPAPVRDAIAPAVYSAAEQWKETIKKNEFLSIEVDADILMPEAAAYPVERLEPVVLTQEKVDELIAYFTEPGTKFYTGRSVKLKSEYEEDIIRMKQSLQKVLNGGDGEDPEAIRSYIKEAERKMAQAPESYDYTYVEPVFTYLTDYETGKPKTEQGENAISVSIEWPDGKRNGTIGAMRYEKGKQTSSGFSFSNFNGGWNLESYFTWYDEELKWQMENPPQWAENDGGEWEKDMKRQREFVDAGLALMQTNNMDLDAAKEKAINLLKELGIHGLQLESCEKALFSRDREAEIEEYTVPACYVTFTRECGGIPAAEARGGSFSWNQDYSELYCAPFNRESVSMLISEEGVERFGWGDMARPVERVAENTVLMPLEQIKQHILNYIYFMDAAWLDGKSGAIRINIQEMRLVTTYINAKDDPERVLIVPAWHVIAQEEYKYDQTDRWQRGNKEEYMINALDGSGILSPGMLKRLEQSRARHEAFEKEQAGE